MKTVQMGHVILVFLTHLLLGCGNELMLEDEGEPIKNLVEEPDPTDLTLADASEAALPAETEVPFGWTHPESNYELEHPGSFFPFYQTFYRPNIRYEFPTYYFSWSPPFYYKPFMYFGNGAGGSPYNGPNWNKKVRLHSNTKYPMQCQNTCGVASPSPI